MDMKMVKLIVLSIKIELVHVENTGVNTDLHTNQVVNQTVQKKAANY